MPHWTHLVFEFGIYGLFAICFVQAWHNGRRHWFMLLGACAFGLLAEALGASPRTVGNPFEQPWQLAGYIVAPANTSADQFGYYYGEFVFKVFGDAIPVCIGVGWAIVLYSAYRTVLRLDALPVWARPFLAASLALTVDLIMDPIASNLVESRGESHMDFTKGLGMWYWFDNEGSSHYHVFEKVPLPNFMGWFMVVYMTVLISRFVWDRFIHRLKWVDETSNPQTGPWWKDAVIVLLIIGLAMVGTWLGVNGFHWLYQRFELYAALFVVFFLLVPGPLMFMYYVPVLRQDWPIDWASLSVGLSFSLFFLVCAYLFGYFETIRNTAYALPITFLISLLLYLWPYRQACLGHPIADRRPDPIGV